MSWILKVRDRFLRRPFPPRIPGEMRKSPRPHLSGGGGNLRSRARRAPASASTSPSSRKKLAEILPDHALLNEVYPFNPSAENLARRFFEDLKPHFPVRAVTVWESEDASATYTEDR